ncbi:MAG: helix-turn-helix domain-containing protein [Streptosporangiaceae bacterium]
MPASKPLRADARRNRDRVLDAARTAFAAEGLTVSLDELAKRAGVGPGTLYRHFPTKESLFEAVMHDRLGRLADEGAALENAADPGAAFFAFLDVLAAELTALLSGMLFAIQPRPGTDETLVLSVFKDGLRPARQPIANRRLWAVPHYPHSFVGGAALTRIKRPLWS